MGVRLSRVRLISKFPGTDVWCGLDRHLGSYFVQVFESGDDEKISVELRSRWSPSEVVEQIERWAAPGARRQAVIAAILGDRDPGRAVPREIKSE